MGRKVIVDRYQVPSTEYGIEYCGPESWTGTRDRPLGVKREQLYSVFSDRQRTNDYRRATVATIALFPSRLIFLTRGSISRRSSEFPFSNSTT